MVTFPVEDSLQIVSSDVERLFNTAYCASIIAQYIYAYQQASASIGMPYMLTYLCLPLTLHNQTKTEVNKHTLLYGFHRFINEHPETLINLYERIKDFTRLTQETLLTGTTYGLMQIDLENVVFTSRESTIKQIRKQLHNEKEAAQSIRAAARIGTWFAQLSVTEIFFYLGIQP